MSWSRIRELVETASWIAIIIGAFVAVQQIKELVRTERVSTALYYLAQFNEGQILDSRQRLLEIWLPYFSEIREINEDGDLPSRQRRRFVRILFENALDQGRNLRVDVINIANFLDQISLCVEMKTCDEEISRRYFSEYAYSFACLFDEQLEIARTSLNHSELGAGLDYFVGDRSC